MRSELAYYCQFFMVKNQFDSCVSSLNQFSRFAFYLSEPQGKGSFGEIFLASDDISKPVTSENAKFVVKIEPHKSGPLFVEIHCLIKSGKPTGELQKSFKFCSDG